MSIALRNIDLMNLAGFCRNCFWAKVGTSSTERGFANVRFASFGLKAPREGYVSHPRIQLIFNQILEIR